MQYLDKYFADLTPQQHRQFALLEGLYLDWNRKINVISRKDLEQFELHHVLHSLAMAAVFRFEEGSEVLDLGTGGGFPAIPLAIFFPGTQFLAVDSVRKKLGVVQAIAAEAGIPNISVLHSRVEAIQQRKFDVVVSRAVAPLGELWQWSRPLLRGRPFRPGIASGLICLKGGDLNREIAESQCRPRVFEIGSLYEEDYFREKYLLQVS